MSAFSEKLPYVDQHTVAVAAPREVVWRALEQYVAAFISSVIFEDGFESGDTGAWSGSVP